MGKRRILHTPFYLSAKNRFFPDGTIPVKTFATLAFCLGICLLLYLLSQKTVSYFHQQNELGIILSLKIFQMSWIILFAMVIFSCMVSAVSSLFLSQDNEILFAAPVTPAQLFSMRYSSTTVFTAWMMILFSTPIFLAYGQVFSAGPLYWPMLLIAIFCTALAATSFGTLATVILVNIFPARRTKDIVLYLSLCFGLFLYLMFRLLRPEDLVNPDKYAHFIEYLSALSTPAGPYVPAAWASNLLSLYLLDQEIDWLLLGLIITTPVSLFILGEWAMNRWFFSGFTKAQESFGGYRRFKGPSKPDRHIFRWVFRKESKLLLRDSAEWSQLFMIAALIIVYLYNFKMLPVDRSYMAEEYLTNLISFLNIGLTGFMVASLAARFVYPAISSEGGAFYIIQNAPISLARFLATKYLFYWVPFTLMTLLLLIASNHLLQISGPMAWLSVGAGLLITWTILAMALGFGAIYADFKAESRASSLGSMGVILYLLTAMSFELIVIFLGAYPAYKLVKKWMQSTQLQIGEIGILIAWAMITFALAVFLSLFFLRKGIRSLENPN